MTIKLLLVPLVALFFNGCGQKIPDLPFEIKFDRTEYIETKKPKLRILYPVEKFEITDYSQIVNDPGYLRVNEVQLRRASAVSLKKDKKISFYEKQNIRFNKEF